MAHPFSVDDIRTAQDGGAIQAIFVNGYHAADVKCVNVDGNTTLDKNEVRKLVDGVNKKLAVGFPHGIPMTTKPKKH